MKSFTSDQVQLGFIGVGAMGSRLVQRLRGHGYEVTVYDLDRSKAVALVDYGAWVADSPAEMAENAGVILSCLTNDYAVRDVRGSYLPQLPARWCSK
jgi:3-hydroxyisobutyrate dehydrogenase-like beta-hydroxyacid dehydrogenase